MLDTHSNSWSQPITSGKAPSQREGHSATVVALRVLVFGGAGLDKEDTSVNLCDLHVLDTPTLAWSQPATAGRPPQERRYHSATSVDGVILVFGGQYYDCEADLHFECSNAVYELEVASLRWRECTIEGAAPLRRACHSSVAIGKQVYVVGGRYWDVAEDDYIFLNDVQVSNTATYTPCSVAGPRAACSVGTATAARSSAISPSSRPQTLAFLSFLPLGAARYSPALLPSTNGFPPESLHPGSLSAIPRHSLVRWRAYLVRPHATGAGHQPASQPRHRLATIPEQSAPVGCDASGKAGRGLGERRSGGEALIG